MNHFPPSTDVKAKDSRSDLDDGVGVGQNINQHEAKNMIPVDTIVSYRNAHTRLSNISEWADAE